jgi:hypothetical protein
MGSRGPLPTTWGVRAQRQCDYERQACGAQPQPQVADAIDVEADLPAFHCSAGWRSCRTTAR